MPRKVFVAGEILTAADVNTNLMDQSVMVFDDGTARTAAIPTAVEGMVTYLKDTNLVTVFDGAAYKPVGGIVQVVSTTKTDVFTQSLAGRTDSNDIMTASITPSSTSSKVLVLVSFSASISGITFVGAILRKNNAASGFVGDAEGSRIQISTTVAGGSVSGSLLSSGNMVFLDSPGSVSAQSYEFRLHNFSTATQTVFLNRGSNDSNDAGTGRGASSITLMEVAG